MPIDDIQYLLQNSTEQDFLVHVDSRHRDKRLFPAASEFEVVFDEPFRFVTGVEILNATIPRTMFMMDEYSNELALYALGYGGDVFGTIDASAQIPVIVSSYTNTTGESYRSYLCISPSHRTVAQFKPQDFDSCDNFFTQIDLQLPHALFLDNRDNDAQDAGLDRSKADYPRARFVSLMAPFFVDVDATSSRSIFGMPDLSFEKPPVVNGVGNGFVTYSQIRNNRGRLSLYPYAYDRGAISTKNVLPQNAYRVDEERSASGSSDGTVFVFTHAPEFSAGTVLTSIRLDPRDKGAFVGREVFLRLRPLVAEAFDYLSDCEMNHRFDGRLDTNNPADNVFMTSCIPLTRGMSYELSFVKRTMAGGAEIVSTEDVLSVRVGYAYFHDPSVFDVSSNLMFSVPNTSDPPVIDEYDMALSAGEVVPVYPLQTDKRLNHPQLDGSNFVSPTIKLRRFNVLENVPCSYLSRLSAKVSDPSKVGPQDIFFVDVFDASLVDNQIARERFVARLYLAYDAKSGRLVYEVSDPREEVLNLLYVGFADDSAYPRVLHSLDGTLTLQFIRISKKTTVAEEALLYVDTIRASFARVNSFGLQCPGIVNLAIENYITIRCDEIESLLRGSYNAKRLSPGLGIVNMDVQGFASDRTEFFTVRHKRLHPIGCVPKLSFRFERCTDGEKYDFRGVELHFMLNIRYLLPTNAANLNTVPVKSLLHPDYNPDYLKYLSRTIDVSPSASSSDEDDDY
jgi:hypothetical protein